MGKPHWTGTMERLEESQSADTRWMSVAHTSMKLKNDLRAECLHAVDQLSRNGYWFPLLPAKDHAPSVWKLPTAISDNKDVSGNAIGHNADKDRSPSMDSRAGQ